MEVDLRKLNLGRPPKYGVKMTMINKFWAPAGLVADVTRISRKMGISRSSFIRNALFDAVRKKLTEGDPRILE